MDPEQASQAATSVHTTDAAQGRILQTEWESKAALHELPGWRGAGRGAGGNGSY